MFTIENPVNATMSNHWFWVFLQFVLDSPSGSAVKNPPAMQEPQDPLVRALRREDLLEKEIATHSSVLAWRIPWTEEPGGAAVHGVTKSQR